MEGLSTKSIAFQQKVADCRALYLACGGRHHEYIEREMRSLGHEKFTRRVLYARNGRGRRVPGWPERFGWIERPPDNSGSAALCAEKLCFSGSDAKKNGGYASERRRSREEDGKPATVKQSFTANRAAKPRMA